MPAFPLDIDLSMIHNLTEKGNLAECPACRSNDIAQQRLANEDPDDIIWQLDATCGECNHKASFSCVFTVSDIWWCCPRETASS